MAISCELYPKRDCVVGYYICLSHGRREVSHWTCVLTVRFGGDFQISPLFPFLETSPLKLVLAQDVKNEFGGEISKKGRVYEVTAKSLPQVHRSSPGCTHLEEPHSKHPRHSRSRYIIQLVLMFIEWKTSSGNINTRIIV